ncbi:MAG: polysaccharide biosynthesis/export family protein [Prevotellaceae bacterium]|jgi:polysaccharide export outer membrane protein|nr:polysaccharide biosynthesis/export family protein [Prevotellaceae bacterium]
MKRLYPFFLIAIAVFSGCTSQRKIAYFNDLSAKDTTSINRIFHSAPVATICKGDILAITVSTLDTDAALPFNLPYVGYMSPGSSQLNNVQTIQSYIVDNEGNITMPILGKVNLLNRNRNEAIEVISEKLQPYLKEATVTLRFQNFKVNVLGEVQRPGQYTINNERISILDALALAGDMTIYGQRNNLLVIRDNNGKLDFTRINMNEDALFRSPYFYLQQNDVIYVEPNSTKTISSQNIGLYLQTISTVAALASAVTTIILVGRQ